jgi:hypothetical protein
MVDTESSGSKTNLVVHIAQFTCRAQISSKESKEIIFHNAEPWYPARNSEETETGYSCTSSAGPKGYPDLSQDRAL